jgi:hypothetical protein
VRGDEALDGELVVAHAVITRRTDGIDRRHRSVEVHRALLGAGPSSAGRDTHVVCFPCG